jgi:hypothetical protein
LAADCRGSAIGRRLPQICNWPLMNAELRSQILFGALYLKIVIAHQHSDLQIP